MSYVLVLKGPPQRYGAIADVEYTNFTKSKLLKGAKKAYFYIVISFESKNIIYTNKHILILDT